MMKSMMTIGDCSPSVKAEYREYVAVSTSRNAIRFRFRFFFIGAPNGL
jgi:hypothetical protein